MSIMVNIANCLQAFSPIVAYTITCTILMPNIVSPHFTMLCSIFALRITLYANRYKKTQMLHTKSNLHPQPFYQPSLLLLFYTAYLKYIIYFIKKESHFTNFFVKMGFLIISQCNKTLFCIFYKTRSPPFLHLFNS